MDPAWQSPLWRRVAQSYLLTRESVLRSVDRLDLDEKSADRARFALMQVTEAAAPTNNLLTNPVALRALWDSRGRSVVNGGRHFMHDVWHNGGLPSQVDTRPFEIGVNMAVCVGFGRLEATWDMVDELPERFTERDVVITPWGEGSVIRTA